MTTLARLIAVFGLLVGMAVVGVSLAGEAGATGGVTYYVNSATDMSATDCAAPSNVDCGLDDAITAFNADSTANDADSIVFATGVTTFTSEDTRIINTTSGVSLTIEGNGANSTIVIGNTGSSVFYISNAAVTITALTITGGRYQLGGGVYNEGTATVSDDTFSDNSSFFYGGAFFNAGTAVLTNDAFTDNSSNILGGAVYNGGVATLSGDTFSGDSSEEGGAVFNGADGTLTNDTFAGDSATFGGALFNGGDGSFSDDTFIGDSATYGGGLYNDQVASLTNDTLSSDTASSAGGGIYNVAALDVANSIFDGASCANSGVLADNGYNVESDASCGSLPSDVTNSSSINLASSLAANGSAGPETLAIDPTSSAYDVVPAANCTITTDERGDSRPGVAGASCDAGAFEYQGSPPAVRSAQTVNFASIADVTLGSAPFSVSPTASSGLGVVITSEDPAVCSVSGSTLTILALGTCAVVAAQGGNSQFIPASATQTFRVDAVATPALHAPGRARIRRVIALSTGEVELLVSAPSNGGSRLTSYQYSVNEGRWVSARLGGRVVVRGLSATHVVTLRVRARNAIGAGPSSNVVRVTVH
jgi:hypothetical protein